MVVVPSIVGRVAIIEYVCVLDPGPVVVRRVCLCFPIWVCDWTVPRLVVLLGVAVCCVALVSPVGHALVVAVVPMCDVVLGIVLTTVPLPILVYVPRGVS